MSEPEMPPQRAAWASVLARLVKGVLYVILVLFLVVLVIEIAMESIVLLQLPVHLLIGWMFYLVRVVPQTEMNVELLLCSLGALVLGMIGLQWLMSRLRAPLCWPWRWTLTWCGMLVVMFSTSIAAVGIVHQTGWLFRLPGWIEMAGVGPHMKAMNNARQVVIAARQYASAHDGKFPEVCAEMMPEIVSDSRIFWATVDRGMPLEPLVYAGAGLRDTDYGDLPLVWSSRPSSNGWRVIARLDGSAEVVREEKFQEMLASRREFFARREAAAQIPR